MSSLALAEQYQNPDLRHSALCWTDLYSTGIEASLATIGPLGAMTTRSEIFSALDRITDHGSMRAATRLLGCLPANTLLYDYGEDIMAWTLGNDFVRPRRDRLAEGLEPEGYEPDLLRQARLLSRAEHTFLRADARNLLAHNAVMETVLQGSLDRIDVSEIVRQSWVSEAPMKAKQVGSYALIPLRSEVKLHTFGGYVHEWQGQEMIEESNVQYDMWLDAPAGFGLTYKGVPQAIAAVSAYGTNELFVRQLQGVRGERSIPATGTKKLTYARGLGGLDWRKAMLSVADKVAGQAGMRYLSLIEGQNVPSSTCSLTEEQAIAAYDVPAHGLGFIRADGRWRRPVGQDWPISANS